MSSPTLRVRNKLWLISDTHFGHRNIVKFHQRPESHEVIMLSEWIKAVADGEQILHLGDVWMKGAPWRWAAIISRLPGEKFLILGNHDKQTRSMYERAGFTIVQPFVCCGIAFSHRPVTPEFPLGGEGQAWHTNIHGHIHGNVLGEPSVHDGSPIAGKTYINVSVEAHELKPIRLGNVAPIRKKACA